MGNVLSFLAIVSMSGGWFYFLYICVVFQSYGFLIAGFFVPFIAGPIGLWSFLFGAPQWLIS